MCKIPIRNTTRRISLRHMVRRAPPLWVKYLCIETGLQTVHRKRIIPTFLLCILLYSKGDSHPNAFSPSLKHKNTHNSKSRLSAAFAVVCLKSGFQRPAPRCGKGVLPRSGRRSICAAGKGMKGLFTLRKMRRVVYCNCHKLGQYRTIAPAALCENDPCPIMRCCSGHIQIFLWEAVLS